MNNRKLYANMNLSCKVVSIGQVECSYMATLSLDEHFVASLKVINIEVEFYNKIEGLEEFLICAKASNDYLTLRGTSIIEPYFAISEIVDDNVYSKATVSFWISDIFVGGEYAVEQNNELRFSGFSCQFTDVFELFGMYPYKIENESQKCLFQSATIANSTKTMEFDGGYSCFVAPYVYKKDSDYIFSMQGRLNYSTVELERITTLKEKIRMLELFFDILCGETVTVLDVTLDNGNNIFEYIGLCNYPKNRLKRLSNGSDLKWYPRKSIFKLSDWKDTGKNVIELFTELARNNLLAMESYKQVLLDEQIKIVTYNKFLKVMQMIEGIMRDPVLQQEMDDFNNKKQEVLAKIETEEDRIFINNYCVNNGDSFRKCLKKITRECLRVLSDAGTDKIFRNYDKLITKIINDRDAYTHASQECEPVMSEEEINLVNCCYKEFFRIIVLEKLGISEKLIRMRFLFNAKFVDSYKILFGLTIINVDDKYDTGEFDDEMCDYV